MNHHYYCPICYSRLQKKRILFSGKKQYFWVCPECYYSTKSINIFRRLFNLFKKKRK